MEHTDKKKSFNPIAVILIVAAALIIGGIIFVLNSGAPQRTSTGDSSQGATSDFDRISGLSFVDYQGNTVRLEDFRGKPLVINSWAVWCPFCKKELPDFAALQKEFKDDIVVIAIDREEPREKAQGYTDGLNISNDMLFLLDPSDSFYRTIGGFSMPETIFVDRSGAIVLHKRGPMELSEMRERARELLAAQSS